MSGGEGEDGLRVFRSRGRRQGRELQTRAKEKRKSPLPPLPLLKEQRMVGMLWDEPSMSMDT